MTQSAFSNIENIDRNFKNHGPSEGLMWIDAFDSRLSLRAMGWPDEAIEARSFRRFPDRAVEPLPSAVQALSYSPASAFLSFRTNSTEIAVRMANRSTTAMSHMPLTGSAGTELYVRDGQHWLPLATAVPPSNNNIFERRLIKGESRQLREYRLYLPLYKELEELSIGITSGAEIHPVPPPNGHKPIVFYGTSITQGGCANTAGSDFVSIVGRLLDIDTINLGFSGNGKGEPELAELIREIDARLFVLNYSSNCDWERLRDTLPGFVRILREMHPTTPIVLQGCISFNTRRWDASIHQLLDARRDELMRFYLRTKEAGDRHIYFIDGEGLLPPNITGAYVDGVHPTSHGFALMAERLAPHLSMILHWEQENRLA